MNRSTPSSNKSENSLAPLLFTFSPLFKDRTSFSLELYVFLIQMFVDHGCLCEYVFRLRLFSYLALQRGVPRLFVPTSTISNVNSELLLKHLTSFTHSWSFLRWCIGAYERKRNLCSCHISVEVTPSNVISFICILFL